MGWLNTARSLIRYEGKQILRLSRQTGQIVAPELTRRVSRGVKKHRRVIRTLSKLADETLDVADAYTSGDIAQGLHSGRILGQTVEKLMEANARKANVPRLKRNLKLQTRAKRQGRDASGPSSLEQFDSNVANDPKISGDLLARMTKSVRSRVPVG